MQVLAQDATRLAETVMAVHISGHCSAVNSAGLRKIGDTAATADQDLAFATMAMIDFLSVLS